MEQTTWPSPLPLRAHDVGPDSPSLDRGIGASFVLHNELDHPIRIVDVVVSQAGTSPPEFAYGSLDCPAVGGPGTVAPTGGTCRFAIEQSRLLDPSVLDRQVTFDMHVELTGATAGGWDWDELLERRMTFSVQAGPLAPLAACTLGGTSILPACPGGAAPSAVVAVPLAYNNCASPWTATDPTCDPFWSPDVFLTSAVIEGPTGSVPPYVAVLQRSCVSGPCGPTDAVPVPMHAPLTTPVGITHPLPSGDTRAYRLLFGNCSSTDWSSDVVRIDLVAGPPNGMPTTLPDIPLSGLTLCH